MNKSSSLPTFLFLIVFVEVLVIVLATTTKWDPTDWLEARDRLDRDLAVWLAQPLTRSIRAFFWFSSGAFAVVGVCLFRAAQARGSHRILLPLGERSRLTEAAERRKSDRSHRIWYWEIYGAAFSFTIVPLLYFGWQSRHAYTFNTLIILVSAGVWLMSPLLIRLCQEFGPHKIRPDTSLLEIAIVSVVLAILLVVTLGIVSIVLGILCLLLFFGLPALIGQSFGALTLTVALTVINAISIAAIITEVLQRYVLTYQSVFCGGDPPVKLESVSEAELTAYLSPAEQVAAELGNLTFHGWRVPGQSGAVNMHIRAVETEQLLECGHWCDRCQEWTVKVMAAQTVRSGFWQRRHQELTKRCFCCQHEWVDRVR